MDQAQMIGIAVGLGSILVLLLIIFIKTNIVICRPNEVVVLSGKKRRTPDGKTLGYRIIRGGRGFKWPLIETVTRLPLTTRMVEVRLSKVLCAGMIPISVEGRGNVKLAGREEEGLENAVERFVEKGVDAVDRTAQHVLEGALRGVLASVSPEDANANRLELADKVVDKARKDLSNLGIVLDFFQIQNISDDQQYLESIGRKRNAEVLRDARIAEATADAESRQVAAKQSQVGRKAEVDSDMNIIEYENQLALKKAELETKSNRAREQAAMATEIARIEEKIVFESNRAELSSKKQESDVIIPAEAKRKAKKLEAEGNAAQILEDGKATAEAVELMRKEWQNGDSHELFMIRMFPELLEKVTKVIAENLRVDKLTILDSGEGTGLPKHVSSITNSAIVLLEQLKNATGVDLAKIAKRMENDTKDVKLPEEKR
jgi:flotillin